MSKSSNMFLSAAQRGSEFLLSLQNEDGCIGTRYILDHYKAPWALVATGHAYAAQKLLNWLRENSCTSPGQFHNGDTSPQVLRSSTYRNVFIMISALKLGDFSIYNEGSLQNLSSYQDNATGAFYGEEHYNDSVLLNTNHSSMAGLFCLMAGMSRRALMVGDFVLNHIKQQPHINDRFYIHTDSKGQLITDFSEEDSFWYAIDYSQPSGHYWAIGTGAYFLTELFLYTRREKYLKGARILLDLCKRLPGGFETWPSSGKVAWAAAKMYSVTRDEDYIKLATSVGQGCLIESQRSDGSWGPFAFSMGKGGGYHLSVPELTAEFSLLCGAIALDV